MALHIIMTKYQKRKMNGTKAQKMGLKLLSKRAPSKFFYREIVMMLKLVKVHIRTLSSSTIERGMIKMNHLRK